MRDETTMDMPSPDLLIQILRTCAERSPEPIYPAVYSQATGVDRAALDHALDRLRTGGWLELTDWVMGQGQGYAITEEGKQALKHPNLANLIHLAGKLQSSSAERRPEDPEHLTPWDRGEAVRGSLMEIPPPVVTMTLMVLNVLMFLAGAFLASQRGVGVGDFLASAVDNEKLNELFLDLGALNSVLVVIFHQWWRLFTYMFLHAGMLHIGLNMYALFSIGQLLESMWGRARYLYLYVVSGVLGGVAVVLGLQPAVGASGAICGLLTSMVCWIWLNRSHLGEDVARRWLRSIFVNIALIAAISLVPGVSALGHLGGGVAGLLVGFPMVYQRFGTPRQRWLGLLGMLAVPLLAVGILLAMHEPLEETLRQRQEAFQRDREVKLRQLERDLEVKPFKFAAATFLEAEEKLQPALQAALALTLAEKLPTDTEGERETMRKGASTAQKAMAQIENAGPFREANMSEGHQLMLNCLQSSIEVLTRTEKAAANPEGWSREVRNGLAKLLAQRKAAIEALVENRSVREIGNIKLVKKPG